jgi:mevalonate pyrophosphate decarboxylase
MPTQECDRAEPRRGKRPRGRLAYLACGAASRTRERPSSTGLTLRISSDIPAGSGLGSSAALSVGVVAAVSRHSGSAWRPRRSRDVAKQVEARQHGRPSGVDVEAVIRGGTLWCRRSAEGTLECEPLAPRPGASDGCSCIHTGVPLESTGEMVAAVARLRDREPRRVDAAMGAIDAATREAREVLESDGAEDRLRALMTRAEAALETLEVVPDDVVRAIRGIEAQGGCGEGVGSRGRDLGAGLVLVIPPPGALASVPASWKRLSCRLRRPGSSRGRRRMSSKATVTAPANIAFIKYWGAKDLDQAVPVNTSVSMTLTECTSLSTVEFAEGRDGPDRIEIVGEDGSLTLPDASFRERIQRHLERVRRWTGRAGRFRVATRNSFPTGTGLASSASGFAALAIASTRALGLSLDVPELSTLARMSGSGSAARSVIGGYVEWSWDGGPGGHATALAPAAHWDLRDVIAIVESGTKEVSSLEGHPARTVEPALSGPA